MDLSLPVVLKGLGCVGVVGVTATGIVCRESIYELATGEINYQKYLNLPKGCGLNKTCTIGESIKTINFTGKTGNWTATGASDVKLRIEKSSNTNDFQKGLKFIFITPEKVEIKEGDASKITLEAYTNTEFKLEKENNGYYLKQSWDVTTLSSKLGLTCPKSNGATECNVTKENQKINVFKDNEDYIINAGIPKDKKIKFSSGQAGYNQGFKFTVEEDITLTKEGSEQKKSTGGISQITKDKKSYEIGIKNINNKEKWFLIEKDDQEVKEKLLGINCESNNQCKLMEGRTITEPSITANDSITKASASSDTTNYPDGFKYTLNSKNYKIECTSGKYKLTEVTASS